MKVKFFDISYVRAQSEKTYAQALLEKEINTFIEDKIVRGVSYTSAGGNHCAVVLYDTLEKYHDAEDEFLDDSPDFDD